MPPRPDLSFAGFDNFIFRPVVSETVTSLHQTETSASKTSKESMEKSKTVRPSAPIIEDWESDIDDDCVFRPLDVQKKPKFINFVKSGEHVKLVNKENTPRQEEYPRKSQSPRSNRRILNGIMTQKLGKATGQREVRSVWNNAQRVNHQNKLTHPHPGRNFVPAAVLTKSGQVLVNTAKQSFPRAAVSNSTARYVNTAASRPTVNVSKPSSNVFNKSHSPVRRPFHQKSAVKTNNFNKIVNTVRFNNVTTAGPKAVVSAAKGNGDNAVKSLIVVLIHL
ncbi:hypothetical protein Tco_1260970 [Tanacetum coccineum]